MSKLPEFQIIDDEIWAKWPSCKFNMWEVYVSHLGRIKEIPKNRLLSLEQTIRNTPAKRVKGWTNKNRETVNIGGNDYHQSSILCESFIGDSPTKTNFVVRENGKVGDIRLLNCYWEPGPNSTHEIQKERRDSVVRFLKKEYGKYALL